MARMGTPSTAGFGEGEKAMDTMEKYEQQHLERMKALLERVAEILKASQSQEAVLDYECGSEHFTLILCQGSKKMTREAVK